MVIMEAPSNEKNRPFIDCRGVCSGHGSCMANLLAAPFVLTWRATEIYCIPAMDVLLNRCLSWSLRKACYCCLDCPCFTFTDKSFPANATSLGKVKDGLARVAALGGGGQPARRGQRPVHPQWHHGVGHRAGRARRLLALVGVRVPVRIPGAIRNPSARTRSTRAASTASGCMTT